MKISIIVYCYNESDNLEKFHYNLSEVARNLETDYEIIYIDDGSEDTTFVIMQVLAQHSSNVKYISLSRHFGRNGAVCAGLEHAKGDAMVVMDGNFSHPPYVIHDLVGEYKKGFHQVIAKNQNQKSSPKSIEQRILSKFINYSILDGESDYRLLSRRATNAILSMPESNRFSNGLYEWIGFKSREISFVLTSRIVKKEIKISRLKIVSNMLENILCYNTRPLRMLTKLGIILTSLGLLYYICSMFMVIMFGERIPGHFTIMSGIILFCGLQLVMVALIGEYIGKIYYETKRRPHYIVQETNYDE
ncbi:glycosyltransferase family 2 protein [Bacillus sp. RG28]|uniref:Glycosyltransferase family 2 protein n=1 Tax=Gottfriedia endophytica TaxID=2820819 RepID=A0A940NQF6_9BACI|nr:glycosyltransferase family 2 protein [Gottfriedia endophytica]MBP0724991.1 glycosyltransferase family 2 protein [Gottfriedia endophytica]